MGVSKNNGTPKWMVYKGNPIKMDDLGTLGTPIFGNTHMFQLLPSDPLITQMEVTIQPLFKGHE